jgi:hypothetical protein
MKFIGIVLAATFGVSAVAYGHSHRSHPKSAPCPAIPKPAPARLEGTILTPDGLAVWEAGNHSGIHIRGVSEDGRAKFDVASDPTMGGLYRVSTVPAGIYDLSIRTGYVNGIAYCPQEIFGVELKPNERTVLNVVMGLGETLNVQGTPVYPTPAAARAAEEAMAKAKADALAQQQAAVANPTPTK